MREWQTKASEWCYKRRARAALHDLLEKLDSTRHFFLSYSEDGQIPHEEVISILAEFGKVQVFEKRSRRYKSSNRPHKDGAVIERLYHLRKNGGR